MMTSLDSVPEPPSVQHEPKGSTFEEIISWKMKSVLGWIKTSLPFSGDIPTQI